MWKEKSLVFDIHYSKSCLLDAWKFLIEVLAYKWNILSVPLLLRKPKYSKQPNQAAILLEHTVKKHLNSLTLSSSTILLKAIITCIWNENALPKLQFHW